MAYVENLYLGKVKQLGNPHAKDRMDRQWETAMYKERIYEKVWLGKVGLEGDEVADTKNHGGEEKAIFAYPSTHYNYWKSELKSELIDLGSMGENLAVIHMNEDTVCIGDTYQFCDTLIQVSQPRKPCWKPARRFRMLDFALKIQESGKTGWYFSVIKEGFVQEKQDLILVDRPYPQWTITNCNEVMYMKKDDLKLAEELSSCEPLADTWKQNLVKRMAEEIYTIENRIYGPNIEEN